MMSSNGNPKRGERQRHPRAIRVLIVEDHDIVAQTLWMMLEAAGDFKIVGRSRTVADAISAARRTVPDVVLLDYRLPDGTGALASARIRRQPDPPAVVVLSGDNREETRRECFEAGACDFLHKSVDVTAIPRAVQRAAAANARLHDRVPV